MVVSGRKLIGPIIGIIGTSMMLIAAFLSIFDPMFLVTLSIGLLGLIGAILGFTGKRIAGGSLMLIAGIIPYLLFYFNVGSFFLIGYSYIAGTSIFSNLVLFALDPILLIIGGFLGLLLRKKVFPRDNFNLNSKYE